MTREEAIKCLKSFVEIRREYCDMQTMHDEIDALDIAIEALEQEPVLDKIRAEILEEKECAYADFERYKVEYLGQDWEDALDSLPQDDFRYGMERCIDIINKCKAERSEKNENIAM